MMTANEGSIVQQLGGKFDAPVQTDHLNDNITLELVSRYPESQINFPGEMWERERLK